MIIMTEKLVMQYKQCGVLSPFLLLSPLPVLKPLKSKKRVFFSFCQNRFSYGIISLALTFLSVSMTTAAGSYVLLPWQPYQGFFPI